MNIFRMVTNNIFLLILISGPTMNKFYWLLLFNFLNFCLCMSHTFLFLCTSGGLIVICTLYIIYCSNNGRFPEDYWIFVLVSSSVAQNQIWNYIYSKLCSYLHLCPILMLSHCFSFVYLNPCGILFYLQNLAGFLVFQNILNFRYSAGLDSVILPFRLSAPQET